MSFLNCKMLHCLQCKNCTLLSSCMCVCAAVYTITLAHAVTQSNSSLRVECISQWVKRKKSSHFTKRHTHTHTPTHTHSVGKTQWCIPAHISPAGDNCAISQRVPETLFTACCGGMGGGYELMSSKRKTTSSRMCTHKHRNKLAHTHTLSTHQSVDCLFSADKIGNFSYRDP